MSIHFDVLPKMTTVVTAVSVHHDPCTEKHDRNENWYVTAIRKVWVKGFDVPLHLENIEDFQE